jgi:hypothetical protein
MTEINGKKMVTVTITECGGNYTELETRVNVGCVKKNMGFDEQYDTERDLGWKIIQKAVDKLFTPSCCFHNSNPDYYGQIIRGDSCITNTVRIDIC